MQKLCRWCGSSFEFTADDRALLTKLSPEIAGKRYDLPPPTLCFPCRLRRRLAFYNCRTLYHRKCDATGKEIISIYSPDKPLKVYMHDVWWRDSWDPMSYGRDVDFSRPFLEQVAELRDAVPQVALAILGDNENSDYTNDNYKTKNCYLVFDGEQAESCYYGNTYARIKSCVDFLGLMDCELCYDVTLSGNCYNLHFSRYCFNCSDSWFLRNCTGCKQCFGCANLRQKQYYVWNEKKTKGEYEDFLAGFSSSKYSAAQAMRRKTEEFFATQPVKALRGAKNVDCYSDSIMNCKNAYMCFEGRDLWDCRYCTGCLMGARDCMDIHIWGDKMELCYESALVGAQARSVIGGYYVLLGVDNILYSLWCSRGSANLFGCVSLKHANYCILNKQYTKEEYEELAPRVIALMQERGEWGEFFDPTLSAFGYNETKAQEYYPLTRKEVQHRGWKWCDYEAPVEAKRVIRAEDLPDDTHEILDDVLNWAILSEGSGKPFKLVKPELQFYRDHRLPLPRRHPDQRHLDRMALRNPFIMYERPCTKCLKPTPTTFPPNHPYAIQCEQCYEEMVSGGLMLAGTKAFG